MTVFCVLSESCCCWQNRRCLSYDFTLKNCNTDAKLWWRQLTIQTCMFTSVYIKSTYNKFGQMKNYNLVRHRFHECYTQRESEIIQVLVKAVQTSGNRLINKSSSLVMVPVLKSILSVIAIK